MNSKRFSPDRFKQALEKFDWTVAHFCFELSKELNEGISQTRVYNWLSGMNRPDKAMVLVFAKLLDEPISYFYEQIEVSP